MDLWFRIEYVLHAVADARESKITLCAERLETTLVNFRPTSFLECDTSGRE